MSSEDIFVYAAEIHNKSAPKKKKKLTVDSICTHILIPLSLSFLSMRLSLSFAGMSPEDEWYNKSLSALRMNSSHHPNLSAPMLQYQT